MKTMKGKAIQVIGNELKVGVHAPDFYALDSHLERVYLHDITTDFVILNVVPSLDTSVCDLQTRRINEKLANFAKTKVITISNDLPFAQKRWCGASGLDILTLSDYKDLDFANKYGVNIVDYRLLARSVFVLDKNRVVVYLEYLENMGNHPDYEQLFQFLDKTIKA